MMYELFDWLGADDSIVWTLTFTVITEVTLLNVSTRFSQALALICFIALCAVIVNLGWYLQERLGNDER